MLPSWFVSQLPQLLCYTLIHHSVTSTLSSCLCMFACPIRSFTSARIVLTIQLVAIASLMLNECRLNCFLSCDNPWNYKRIHLIHLQFTYGSELAPMHINAHWVQCALNFWLVWMQSMHIRWIEFTSKLQCGQTLLFITARKQFNFATCIVWLFCMLQQWTSAIASHHQICPIPLKKIHSRQPTTYLSSSLLGTWPQVKSSPTVSDQMSLHTWYP